MSTAAAAGFFRLIQLALLPLGVAGYVAAVPRLLAYSRRTGASATALASLYTRYMQHRLETRRDDPAARLMAVMPNVSQAAFRLEAAPTLVGHLLTGYVPRIYRYPYQGQAPMVHQSTARTSFYDAAVQRHLSDVDQFVVLGAGFDTRAFRLPPGGGTRCFEIDMPRTLAYKVRMLEKADLSTGLATYVPADFETEDWMEKLVAAGFDPARPALFIWEAVTMYLDGGAVQATLRKIAAAAPGSAVAFDYFSREIVASRSPYMRYARAATRFVGEPLTFGIDNTPPARKSAADFVGSFGLVLEEHRNFGRETRRRSAPAGFVTAVVTSGPANRAEHRNEGKP